MQLLVFVLLLASSASLRLGLRMSSSTFASSNDKILDASEVRNPASGWYDEVMWAKAFASQKNEYDYFINDIEGNVPSEITGTLFRAMPSLFERNGKAYGHYLDGDGYVARITFSKGKAHFLSKFVQTEEYIEESKENKVLYRSTFRTQREPMNILGLIDVNNAFDLKLKNQANTNVIYWNKKLLALFEAAAPIELNPNNLDTFGYNNLGIGHLKQGMSVFIGKVYDFSKDLHDRFFGSSFTAHPKIDLINKKLIGWSWRALVDDNNPLKNNPLIEFYEFNEDFGLSKEPVRTLLNYTQTAPHDFSLSQKYYLMVQNRVEGNTLPYILGTKTAAQCVNINPSLPMMLTVISRNGAEETVHIPLTAGFTIHSVNAFETDETIELLTSAWDVDSVRSGKVSGGLLGNWEGVSPVFDKIPNTLLYHTIVDKNTKQLRSHKPAINMENVTVEHPHINPLFEGLPIRYIFTSLGSTESKSSPPIGYVKLDLQTGERQEWFAPLNTFCEELVIIPKKQNYKTEDDGTSTHYSAPIH
jgi:all-trans-8'-apo-beta-carotenal 15,15'-oxygenase